jgi:hypothetical protein
VKLSHITQEAFMKTPATSDYLTSESANLHHVDYFICMGFTDDREELEVHSFPRLSLFLYLTCFSSGVFGLLCLNSMLNSASSGTVRLFFLANTQSMWYALENLVSNFEGKSEPTLWIDRYCMRWDKREEQLQ